MATSLADDSALLSELRALAEQGRHREVLGRLHGLPVEALEGRTAFALLAAEAHGRLGEYSEAQRWAELVLALARSRGEGQAELRALNYKGAIALRGGDVDEAELRFAEALTVARAVQDHRLVGLALTGRAETHLLMSDAELAAAELARAAEAYQRVQFAAGLPEVWRLQAGVARTRGDTSGAIGKLEQAAEVATRQGNTETLAAVQRDLGAALEAQGNLSGARVARQRAVVLYKRLGAIRAAEAIAALIAHGP